MENNQMHAERNGKFIFDIFRSRFGNNENIGIYAKPRFDVIIPTNVENFDNDMFDNRGVYCFYVINNGKPLPFYIGITSTSFRVRFNQHAGNGILTKFWSDYVEVPVYVALIFVSELALSKLIESLFLDTFDFAYNSAENANTRPFVIGMYEENGYVNTYTKFKVHWNNCLHTLSGVGRAYNAEELVDVQDVQNIAENHGNAVIFTFQNVLPGALMYDSLMPDKDGSMTCEITRSGQQLKNRYTFDVSGIPDDRCGLYCIYVEDRDKKKDISCMLVLQLQALRQDLSSTATLILALCSRSAFIISGDLLDNMKAAVLIMAIVASSLSLLVSIIQ